MKTKPETCSFSALTPKLSKVPLAEKGAKRPDDPVWHFQNLSADSTQLMNLLNLPMTDAVATRRLTTEKKDSVEKVRNESMKTNIKKQFQDLVLLQRRQAKENLKGEDARDAAELGKSVESDQAKESSTKEDDANAEKEKALKEGADKGQGAASKDKDKEFKPYSQQERDLFSIVILSLCGTEKRVITALDDLLMALVYAIWHVEMVSAGKKPILQKIDPRTREEFSKGELRVKIVDVVVENIEKYSGTLQFLTRLWIIFKGGNKVVLNAKDCRFWSSLRGELQSVLVKSHQKLFFLGSSSGSNSTLKAQARKGKDQEEGDTDGPGAPLDAMKLAEVLCKSFCDGPVEEVDGDGDDDPEDSALARLVTTKREDPESIDNLKGFVEETLHLPLLMHAAPRQALMTFQQGKNHEMLLVDLLAIMKTEIEKTVPFGWLVFASEPLL